MSHTIYIALGTNLGDRMANLEQACAALGAQLHLQASSEVYETPPWGILDQPKFYNQVVKAETELSPSQLLDFLKRLERKLGRRSSIQNGPRLIDLDILFYDDLQLVTPELTIPHPRIAERAFVLVPLTDIAPELCHPANGKTVQAMLAECDTVGIYPISSMSGKIE